MDILKLLKTEEQDIILELNQQLNNFVLDICKSRDDSHGYLHMRKVSENSLDILFSEWKENNLQDHNVLELIKDVLIVSWLHDIADHKYDYDGTLNNVLSDFIKTITSKSNLLLAVIKKISYSNELKDIQLGIRNNWIITLGEYGLIIRDIVSDADKLEALGKGGFQRMVLFKTTKYQDKYNAEIPYKLLKEDIQKHTNEKLCKLKDEFIKTKRGKELAESLHFELLNAINSM